jgi:alpha-galactosidase
VELDARHLEPAQAQELRGWIAIHKALRDRLHQGRVWRGSCGDGVVWQAHGDDDAADVLLLAYRTRPSDHRYPPPLRLPMLDATARYCVRELLPEGTARAAGPHHSAPFFDAINTDEGLDVQGAWLISAGLPLPRTQGETAFIVRLVKH